MTTNEAPSKPTVDEVVDSLTGYDELAIEERFGSDINTLLNVNPVKGMRALAFVVIKRQNETADVKNPAGKAFEQIMKSPMTAINDHFGDEPDEVMADEPVTEAGKGASETA